MDYPKSVPGVGLVDGKFVDEDQVTGTPGSLIPADWGNAVTEEILNVVREVGDEPIEAQHNQLVGAIWKMFRSATAAATEVLLGVMRVGTQTEVNAGALDNVAVTPKKLRLGFLASLTQNGYVMFPQWLGSWCIQWGTETIKTEGDTISFPLAFPSACWNVTMGNRLSIASNNRAIGAVDPATVTVNGFKIATNTLSGTTTNINLYYIALGK
jgi:hypothetical protein